MTSLPKTILFLMTSLSRAIFII